MKLDQRSLLANDLALFAGRMGHLATARTIRLQDDEWKTSLAQPVAISIGLQNSSELTFRMGRLTEASELSERARSGAIVVNDPRELAWTLCARAKTSHALGDLPAARSDFAEATTLESQPLYSNRGACHARHHLDLGDYEAARKLADHGLAIAHRYGWNGNIPWFHALLARIDLAEGMDPTPHLEHIREWTSRTGDMESIIESHLLTAQHLLATGDKPNALGEVDAGLLHAVSCGYGLKRIELLVTRARIFLQWPNPPAAIQAAREALDLATHPDCGYAWGEADAAQVWGEAYYANGETELAHAAFQQALKVRQRIEHPKRAETEQWLARTAPQAK